VFEQLVVELHYLFVSSFVNQVFFNAIYFAVQSVSRALVHERAELALYLLDPLVMFL
jgi:hypothetical protein